MSIVPVNESDRRRDTVLNPYSLDLWDPENFLSLQDVWDPFPSIFSTHFPSFSREIFPSLETHVDWRETTKTHVFRAAFPGLYNEDVLVYIDDDNYLQISTENGMFMSKSKLPDNAKRDQIEASMANGFLIVIIPKGGGKGPNVKAIEISGSG